MTARPFPPSMVLAAGLGTRMRPLTDTVPKPLVKVAGRSLLDRALDHLEMVQPPHVVVNCHHHADVLKAHIDADQHELTLHISDESDALLDTGGGVVRALPYLGDGSFAIINGDALWTNGEENALSRLWKVWDDDLMDVLLLLVRRENAHGFDGAGDFFMGPDRQLTRRGEHKTAPYVFGGIQIITATALSRAPTGPFSLNWLYDRALETGRLYGLIHNGSWVHVGTPEAIALAEDVLNKAAGTK